MKQVTEIIDAYQKAWHKVDGLFLKDIVAEGEMSQLDILLAANGRDIVIKEPPKGVLDGQDFEYVGEEDPNFPRELYLS